MITVALIQGVLHLLCRGCRLALLHPGGRARPPLRLVVAGSKAAAVAGSPPPRRPSTRPRLLARPRHPQVVAAGYSSASPRDARLFTAPPAAAGSRSLRPDYRLAPPRLATTTGLFFASISGSRLSPAAPPPRSRATGSSSPSTTAPARAPPRRRRVTGCRLALPSPPRTVGLGPSGPL